MFRDFTVEAVVFIDLNPSKSCVAAIWQVRPTKKRRYTDDTAANQKNGNAIIGCPLWANCCLGSVAPEVVIALSPEFVFV
jgi:hypothetical protein